MELVCFNPRARVGRDMIILMHSMRLESFNPRARVGRDSWDISELTLIKVSIHAPAWGATYLLSDRRRSRPVSIHAPAWGATPVCGSNLMSSFVSIHAPAWGATFPFRYYFHR